MEQNAEMSGIEKFPTNNNSRTVLTTFGGWDSALPLDNVPSWEGVWPYFFCFRFLSKI